MQNCIHFHLNTGYLRYSLRIEHAHLKTVQLQKTTFSSMARGRCFTALFVVSENRECYQRLQSISELGMAPVNCPEGGTASGQAFMVQFKTKGFVVLFWDFFALDEDIFK